MSTTKPPIILVHGFRGSPIGLQTISQALQTHGYQVFVPPIPPFGGAKPLTDYTPEAYANYLVNFATSHHLKKPILVGHSMGSIIVAAALHLHPDAFHQQAILLSPISARTAAPFRIIAPLSAIAPAKIVDYVTTRYLFVPHNRELFRQTLDITHKCSSDHAPTQKQLIAAANFSTRYSVGDFPSQKQILLLAGTKDRLISQKQTLRLAEKIHAKTLFLPNTGHLHNYEQPLETAQAIIDFLESAS